MTSFRQREKQSESISKEFQCSICGEKFKYKKFANYKNNKSHYLLLEETFYMDDPFEATSKRPFILGGKCSFCTRTVCINQKCSLYYTKRFCTECVKEKDECFPKEILKDVPNG
uniref:Cysteine-rich DPF motif domain-containing protein 1 n=1 Tax=Clytia hemisphaerica TaxID=252671 RepID=A0A7M6DNU1_9CNID